MVATGSSASRSLGDRFGEVFHVDDYGAKGDWNGTTGTDDTVAIQAAINAAILAGGGIVRFATNKTYFLNTRNTNTLGQTSLGNHLNIYNGTTNTKLYFDGNGSRLYSTTYNASDCAHFYICSQWHTLIFENLIFERNVAPFNNDGAPTCAFRVVSFDENEHQFFQWNKCIFIDCNDAMVTLATKITNKWKKWKQFVCTECKFLYYKACGRGSGTGAGVVVGLSQWIEHAKFDGVYYDGCVGSINPNNITRPKDGFLFPSAKHTQISNSFFTNSAFEVFKMQIPNESIVPAIRLSSFVQPAVTNPATTVNTTVSSNPDGDALIIGNVYVIKDPNRYNIGPIGAFKLTNTTSSLYGVGTTLTFERLDRHGYIFSDRPELDNGETTSSNLFLEDLSQADSTSHFVNNTFYDIPIKMENGSDPSWAYSSGAWADPQIIIGGGGTIVGNTFYGSNKCIDTDKYSDSHYLPINITGNTFYLYTDKTTQPSGAPVAIFAQYKNTIINSNSFIIRESKDVVYVIFLRANQTIITNNSCAVLKSYNVAQSTRFINAAESYDIVCENNYIKNLDNYANSGSSMNFGPFYGTIRGTIASSGDNRIKIINPIQSPDGSLWKLSITNDGEIEVSK